ncbi:MAG: bacillithiol biosynthesis deacetylase BshB1 [Planctomycetota bacterium]|nr:bacillithiol biosynthesis deacetylase BshB1 [Planctomycetota bacterium]MED5400296.1 bacillithiol biosynthesis deacetylase BshB1 [Planctomycetota bacterium]MEE3367405.1 bacillithiol biosynthesis deacetylase BshB1 [Planctomycetota bacterium]
MSDDSNAAGVVFSGEPLDLLVVAAHPDDAEISVGGVILSSVAAGRRVGVLELTNGEPTPRGTVERRAAETAAATEVLGVTWRGNLGLPNRSLQADLPARQQLAEVFRLTRPAVILAPYWEDAHPDHVAASQLVDDARFWSKLSKTEMVGERFWPPRLYYYFSIHLRIHPRPSFVFDISDCIDAKMRAISCYQSQVIEGRSTEFPTVLDDIRDCARYWGWSIGRNYGEPLMSREEIGVSALEVIC